MWLCCVGSSPTSQLTGKLDLSFDQHPGQENKHMYTLTDNEVASLTREFTGRPTSLFAADMEASRETLDREIRGKSVLTIGGAGTIGSSYIKQMLPFEPRRMLVVDTNENGLCRADSRRSQLTPESARGLHDLSNGSRPSADAEDDRARRSV